jgi:hypothetical protein
MKLRKDRTTNSNINYPASAAAVVFGVHLSAQAIFRIDRNRRSALAKLSAIFPCV